MAWPVRLLSLTALAIAGYLFWGHTAQTTLAGCGIGSGFDCDAALSSRWAQWFGVPVLWIGAGCYAAVFVSSWGLARQSEGMSRVAWVVFAGCILLAAGAGLWFLGLQLVGKSEICPYCIGIHSCGLLIATIFGIFLISRRINANRGPATASVVGLRSTIVPTRQSLPSQWLPSLSVPFAIAAIVLLALVGGQLLYVPPGYAVAKANLDEQINLHSTKPVASNVDSGTVPTTEGTDAADENRHSVQKVDPDVASPTEDSSTEKVSTEQNLGSRIAEFLDGKLKIDTYEHPVLGSPDAEFVILEFFDYTCPHCRKTHAMIEEALPKYGDRLAIVMLPVPNDIMCNKYVRRSSEDHRGACKLANLAVATADLDRRAFAKVHDWIMKHENTPSYASSLSQAGKHLDQTDVLKRLAREDVPERVQKYIELFVTLSRTKQLTLPAQVIGDEIVTGSLESAEELQNVWEEKLGIRPAS